MIRLIKNSALIALAIMVTGCATRGDYARVPVEEAASQQGSVRGSTGYPPKPERDQGYPQADYPQSNYPQSNYPQSNYPEPVYSDPQYGTPNQAPSAVPSNSAVIALLSSAQRERQGGDYQRAAATLERAIRISPRNPELYYELAHVRHLEGNYHQSEQLCRKAISLAAGDKVLIERCRSLLSRRS